MAPWSVGGMTKPKDSRIPPKWKGSSSTTEDDGSDDHYTGRLGILDCIDKRSMYCNPKYKSYIIRLTIQTQEIHSSHTVIHASHL